MSNYFAQSINVGGQSVEGPLKGINTLADVINKIIELAIPVAGIILLLVLVLGGYDYLLSQGNPEKIKSGQQKITTGIIGFVLLLLSYLVVKLIVRIFGVGVGVL